MKTAKRFRAFLLTLTLIFTLAGCGAPAAEPTSAPIQSEAAAPAQSETAGQDIERDVPDLSAPPETERQEEPSAAPPERSGTASQAPDTPAPSEEPETPPESAAPKCTVSISCATILDHLDRLDAEKAELVPADGVLLAAEEVKFTEGESVFDLLKRVCRENKLHMEFSETPVYQSAYLEGIGNLYEFDVGELSGWMYKVNGWFPNYGCSGYQLKDGDVVEWVYTCDLGADVGGGLSANG